MKPKEVRILLCIIIAIVTGAVISYEKPNVSPSAHEYYFQETLNFEPKNWVIFGNSVSYVDGHLSNTVTIALNNVKPIESFRVFLDNGEIKIIYTESELGQKKDRLFLSSLVRDFDMYLDHVKLFNNNKRNFFVKTEWSVE